MQSLIHDLYALGALKFGSFLLKSKIISPFYLDLRLCISSPALLTAIADTIRRSAAECSYDLLCGVPYTALPFATAFSIRHAIPMVLKRKEKKEHGTGKWVEGIYRKGQRCLVIEDVVTSGQSLLETIQALEEEGLVVHDAIVFVDRQQGGRRFLESKGYQLHSVLTIEEIAQTLAAANIINQAALASIRTFVLENQIL